MTASEDEDRRVLESLGFGVPSRLDSVQAQPAPLTRREAREIERAAEAGARSRGSKPSRASRRSVRRDAVRRAATAHPSKKTLGARLLSVGAMLFVGALGFGMTVPANAFGPVAAESELASTLAVDGQTVDVDPTLVSYSERDGWTVTSWAEMLRLRYGNRDFSYTVGTGPIRWPFPVAVPISSGFGDRAAPCQGCSTSHSGIDFNPGYGAAIFAIADGTVAEVSASGSSWGHYVRIQHEIDGQTYFSGYAHMVSGSSPLQVGDPIRVGDFVGLVGASGQATGAHLHFTIEAGEQYHFIDPYTFLKTYAS